MKVQKEEISYIFQLLIIPLLKENVKLVQCFPLAGSKARYRKVRWVEWKIKDVEDTETEDYIYFSVPLTRLKKYKNSNVRNRLFCIPQQMK